MKIEKRMYSDTTIAKPAICQNSKMATAIAAKIILISFPAHCKDLNLKLNMGISTTISAEKSAVIT